MWPPAREAGGSAGPSASSKDITLSKPLTPSELPLIAAHPFVPGAVTGIATPPCLPPLARKLFLGIDNGGGVGKWQPALQHK